MLWQFVLQTNVQAQMPWLHSGLPVRQYFLWVALQPLLGAIAAIWSQKYGGTPRILILASLLPSIVLFALWVLVLSFGILVEKDVHILQQPQYIILGPMMWAGFPGLALLLGAFPFLKRPKSA